MAMSLKKRCQRVAPKLYAMLDWRCTENEVWGDGWFDDYYSLRKQLTDEQLKEVETLVIEGGKCSDPYMLCKYGYLNYA